MQANQSQARRFVWLEDDIILPQTNKSHSYQQSPAEKRVDFAAIEKALDGDAVKTDLALRVPIRKVLDDLIALIRNQDKAGGITQGFIQGLTLTTGPEAQQILGEYLLGIWRKGRELAAGELPEKIKQKIAPIRTFHLQGLHDQQDHDPTGGGGINFGDGKTPLTEEKIKTILPTIKKGKFIDITTHDKYGGTTQTSKIRATVIDSIAVNGKHRLKLKITDETFKSGTGRAEKIQSRIGQELIWDSDDIPRRAITGIKVTSHESESVEVEIVELHVYAGLEPVQAINFFQNLRPWLVKGIIDDELKKKARLELTEHLKGGRTLTETIGNLRSAWEPWIGNPEKVIPSGISGKPEDILQAYRLENIVRTEAITALSQGRAAIADEAGDFVVGFELSPILDVDTHLPLSETRGSLPCNRIRDLIDMDRPVRFKKDDPRSVKLLPPLLYNCRTIEIFITTDDLPVRWSTEAELDSVLRLIPSDFK